MSVDDILEALANRWSAEEVAENYRIPVEAVYEALRFALETLGKVEVITVEATS
ncbi:MAG: DUF433 domain-containing protein [Desulfurococcales archaeon]|nr:DUF433 domain-containing protein [Desulfurococcales archaeon]